MDTTNNMNSTETMDTTETMYTPKKLFEKCRETIEKELSKNMDETSLRKLLNLYISDEAINKRGRALELYEKYKNILTKNSDLLKKAQLLAMLGKKNEAYELYELLITKYINKEQKAQCYLAMAYCIDNDPEESLEYAREAKKLYQELDMKEELQNTQDIILDVIKYLVPHINIEKEYKYLNLANIGDISTFIFKKRISFENEKLLKDDLNGEFPDFTNSCVLLKNELYTNSMYPYSLDGFGQLVKKVRHGDFLFTIFPPGNSEYPSRWQLKIDSGLQTHMLVSVALVGSDNNLLPVLHLNHFNEEGRELFQKHLKEVCHEHNLHVYGVHKTPSTLGLHVHCSIKGFELSAEGIAEIEPL